jgi:hypothetical protein
MAYTRQADAKALNDPLVVSVYVNNSAAETNVPVYIPYNDVRCVYIYSVVATAIDGDGNMEVDFEYVDAGGTTEFATLTVAASAAVGDIDEATISDAETARKFHEKSYINIEVDGSTTGTGAINIFFYFEPIL